MAWTQQDVDALKAALKSGSRVVRHGETSVEYRSLDEMKELLVMMQAEVNPTAFVRRTVAKMNSGV